MFPFLDIRIEPKEKETNAAMETTPQAKCLLCVSVSFSDAVIKYPEKRDEGFLLFIVPGYSPSWWGAQGS